MPRRSGLPRPPGATRPGVVCVVWSGGSLPSPSLHATTRGGGRRDAPARAEHVDVPAAAARERQRNGIRALGLSCCAVHRRPLAPEPDASAAGRGRPPRARGPRGAFGILADAGAASCCLRLCPLVGATRAVRGLPPSHIWSPKPADPFCRPAVRRRVGRVVALSVPAGGGRGKR